MRNASNFAMIRRLLLLLFFPLSLLAEPMTNEDVIRLVDEAGFTSQTLLLLINNQETDFDVTADALAELAQAGVPEDVIKTMILASARQAPAGAPAGNTVASTSPAPRPAPEPDPVEAADLQPPEVDPVPGRTYYLRYSMRYEGADWPTTNYARGTLAPINSAVELVSLGDERMTIRFLASGDELIVVNVERFSRRTLNEIARKMLSPEKIAIERLDDRTAQAIKRGEVRAGMTRDEVLMARGYPPGHRTPSLSNSEWTYWRSRFGKSLVTFRGDEVASTRGF